MVLQSNKRSFLCYGMSSQLDQGLMQSSFLQKLLLWWCFLTFFFFFCFLFFVVLFCFFVLFCFVLFFCLYVVVMLLSKRSLNDDGLIQ